MFSDALIVPWFERVRRELPGLALFDVHTHIGANDPDGYRCTAHQLLEALELAAARAVVFPMQEPEGYPAANDRVIAEAAASEGRLVAFCRIDPAASPLPEVERCLEAGAQGIKLHPRAERFALDHPGLRNVFELADERRLPVIVHAGRGIPALGRHAVELCARHAGVRLILAHAGISDLAWIWRSAPDHPNLFFDTAWWAPSDLLALFALVPPGQILLGSDTPYGTPVFSATMALRHALQAGLDAERIRVLAGLQLERLLAGADPLDLGPPPGAGSLTVDPLLDRVHTFLIGAVREMFRAIEPEEALTLAALACEVGDDATQARVCRSILALLEERSRYAAAAGDDGRPTRVAPGARLVVLAAGLARTPDVPVPTDPVPVDVSERATD